MFFFFNLTNNTQCCPSGILIVGNHVELELELKLELELELEPSVRKALLIERK